MIYFAEYDARDKLLTQMGFSDYSAYLESPLWRSIRRQVLAMAKGRCLGCCKKAKQVHHLKYTLDNLRGHKLIEMVAICRKCHETIEFDSGRKLCLLEANEKLFAMRRKRLPAKKKRHNRPLNYQDKAMIRRHRRELLRAKRYENLPVKWPVKDKLGLLKIRQQGLSTKPSITNQLMPPSGQECGALARYIDKRSQDANESIPSLRPLGRLPHGIRM